MKIKYYLAFLLLVPIGSFAQFNYIGVDAGSHSYHASLREYSNIRNYQEADGWFEDGIRTTYNTRFAGLRIELPLSQNFVLSTGLRFAESTTVAERDNRSKSFYYKFRETETLTEYLQLKKIIQDNRFINVPIDLRLQPFMPRRFNMYFVLGFEMNFNVNHSMDFEFYDRSMRVYKTALSNQFDSAKPFHGIISVGTGFAIGKPGKPQVGMDLRFPAWVVANDNAGIAEPTYGGGLQFFFKHPLKTNL